MRNNQKPVGRIGWEGSPGTRKNTTRHKDTTGRQLLVYWVICVLDCRFDMPVSGQLSGRAEEKP
jgi:hypothetical protein